MIYHSPIQNDPFVLVAQIFEELCTKPFVLRYEPKSSYFDPYEDPYGWHLVNDDGSLLILINTHCSLFSQTSMLIRTLSLFAADNNEEMAHHFREYIWHEYIKRGGVT